MTPKVAGPSLFLLSSSLLAFEIALLRVFSIESYHHFAHMAVGVALLGFGASGTALVLLRGVTRGREWRLFPWLLAVTPPALMVSPVLARGIDYDPTQLLWDLGQWWGLMGVYGVLTLPFLVGGAAIALALRGAGAVDGVGRLYAWNLAGSGVGAVGVLLLLHLLPPDRALAWTCLPATMGAVAALASRRSGLSRHRASPLTAALLLAVVTGVALAREPGELSVIHFKGLPQVEAFPGAERVGEEWGPTGWAVGVRAASFRHAPGLSLGYRGTLPDQVALFLDGEVAGTALIHDEPEFLDWLPTASAYALLGWSPVSAPEARESVRSVLVLGSGGGLEVEQALRRGAGHVTAVEMAEPLVRLSRRVVGAESSPYEEEGVALVVGDARAFAGRTLRRYSLVVLPVSGGFNAVAAGIHSGGEDFLNTVDAYRSFLNLLEPDGLLVTTRWTRAPPRDNVKMILTVGEALRSLGVSSVGNSLAFVRSWATGTLLVKPAGFTKGEIDSLREFCSSRFFDLDWPVSTGPPGPVFNQIADPVYREAVLATSSSPDSAGSFADAYPFQVDPATDDRPYFGRFLGFRSVSRLVTGNRADWIPFAEWGYLGVLATLFQSGLLALLLMGLPVLALGVRRKAHGIPLIRSAMYFAGIGFGFMLLEMAAIQRLSLALGHPVYGAAATLGALLVFSGLGSAFSDRLLQGWTWRVCLAAAGVSLVFSVFSPFAGSLSALHPLFRGTVAFTLVASAGLVMGIPFPLGLRRLARSEGGVAWAWAANGVASVLGVSLAILLAMEMGGRGVFLAGALGYAVASFSAYSDLKA